MPERLTLNGSKHPNFIGCWMMKDKSICDRLVEFFECNEALQHAGLVGDGMPNEKIKKSIDITIAPSDLENEMFGNVCSYIEHLKICYLDYLEQWEFLQSSLPNVHIGNFNLQKYDEGNHFGSLHSERTSRGTLHRVHAWMTYLNGSIDGGETEFPMFGLTVEPEKGKTLIWPAEWTHAHLGRIVKKGKKYIITGWMHFPEDDTILKPVAAGSQKKLSAEEY